MRLHRFYVEQPLGEEVVVHDVSIIKQWTKVFRYHVEDSVILFNGDGNDVTFSISSISQKEITLLRKQIHASYIPRKKVTLFLSIIKKDNFELVVQKATELGVSVIIPILSARSEKKNLNIERLEAIATEASEQCGRGDVPAISPITSLTSVLDTMACDVSYVLQMGGRSILHQDIQDSFKKTQSIGLFIGPEGGWSPEEELLFKEKGINPLKLGETVLRAETAAIVAVSCTQL
jgi:16S rRNA (uracil1498-N3)-methyltransferase